MNTRSFSGICVPARAIQVETLKRLAPVLEDSYELTATHRLAHAVEQQVHKADTLQRRIDQNIDVVSDQWPVESTIQISSVTFAAISATL